MRVAWWKYVQRIAGTASPSEISRKTGIGQSSIGRWQHSSPKPENVRAFAHAYSRPVLEAFVEAAIISPEEVEVVVINPDMKDLSLF